MYKAVHEKLNEQIKDVGAARSKEVSLFWIGMAEVSKLFSFLVVFFPNENGVSIVLGYLILLILIWTNSIQGKGWAIVLNSKKINMVSTSSVSALSDGLLPLNGTSCSYKNWVKSVFMSSGLWDVCVCVIIPLKIKTIKWLQNSVQVSRDLYKDSEMQRNRN